LERSQERRKRPQSGFIKGHGLTPEAEKALADFEAEWGQKVLRQSLQAGDARGKKFIPFFAFHQQCRQKSSTRQNGLKSLNRVIRKKPTKRAVAFH